MATPEHRRRPAKTIEARENQLILKAIQLAEQQLEDGSASSQIIAHFLKLATTREALEKEKIRKDIVLLSAKADAVQSASRIEDLYAKALDAMRSYRRTESSEGEMDD